MTEREPDPALIDSMALRYRHDFGLLDEQTKNSIRTTMRQLWEEVVGLGFYKGAALAQRTEPRNLGDEIIEGLEALKARRTEQEPVCNIEVTDGRLSSIDWLYTFRGNATARLALDDGKHSLYAAPPLDDEGMRLLRLGREWIASDDHPDAVAIDAHLAKHSKPAAVGNGD